MSRRVASLVLVLGILASGGRSHAANIAYFNDPAFIDSANEGAHLAAALTGLGHTVTAFTGTAAATWENAINAADVLVIPEMELNNDLFTALPADTRSVIVGHVRAGGGLVVNADFRGQANNLLNGLFGFALAASSSGDPAALNASAAAGTPFAGGPSALPASNATQAVDRPSLPAGALAIYVAPTDAVTVFAKQVGKAGQVVYLGYDWFETPDPVEWVTAMGSAVSFAQTATPQGLTLALFEDPVYYNDPGEIDNLKSDFGSFGDTVVGFTGTTAAAWRAALRGADVLILPEPEAGDLPADLPSDTKDLVGSFVASGGGLVVYADFNGPPGHLITIINSVFGFGLVNGSGTVSTLDGGAAVGTPFAFGPPELPSSNAVLSVTTPSLPSGSLALYTNAASTEAFAVQRGFGRIVYLGFDWFETPSPLAWRGVLRETLDAVGVGANVVVSAPAAAAGAGGVVTADLSGFNGLTTANLLYRAGGDAGFITLPLTGPANAQTATIPGTVVGAKGVQFFLEIPAGPITATSPPLAPGDGAFHNLPVTLTNTHVASLPAASFRLNALPVQAQPNDPVAVFDELGAYNIKKWRYGTFDGSAYREPGNGAANAGPGQGYWIVSKNAADIAVSGTSADLSGPLNITLRQGFNQIGNPFNFPVDFADVVLPAEVEANLIGFDGSGFTPGQTVLLPGQGYWIKNNGPGARVISIPPLGSGVAAAPRAPVNFAEGADWSIRVDAYAGPFNDRGNLFGTRAGASEGRDEFDLSEPPVAPEGWAGVALASASDGALLADWRPTATDGATWQVTFASDQSGEPFRIELVTERELPAAWDVAAFEGAREVDLGDARQITGVVGSTTAPRTFTVAAGDATYLERARVEAREHVTSFALAAPFPNPTSTGVTMDLALPAPVADALVNVYDVQGRLVKTLLRGAVGQGVQRVAWDGRSEAGTRASAGVYFVKARAGEFTASRKVVLLP